MPGGWTVGRKAGAPARTQLSRTLYAVGSSSSRCVSVSRTRKMGARSSGGRVAGAPFEGGIYKCALKSVDAALTDGTYDADAGVFATRSGHPKCFVASDDVESPRYRTLTHDDLFDIAMRHRLHFDPSRHAGVVFHMMSSLGDRGRFGLTAVADTHDDAEALYRKTIATIDADVGG